MRRSLLVTAAAAISMVLLAMLVPMAILVRSYALEDRLARAALEVQVVETVVSRYDDKGSVAVYLDQLNDDEQHTQVTVLYPTGCSNYQILWTVVCLVVTPDRIASDRGNGFVGATDRTTKRVTAKHGLGKRLVRNVLRIVVIHRELFENYRALVFKFFGVNQRRGKHVADYIYRKWQRLVLHPRVVTGVLFAGRRV